MRWRCTSAADPDGDVASWRCLVGARLLPESQVGRAGFRSRQLDRRLGAELRTRRLQRPHRLLPGSRFTTLAFNDARQSEVGIVVEGSDGASTEGLFLHKNRGTVVIEGTPQPGVLAARRVLSPIRAQPLL